MVDALYRAALIVFHRELGLPLIPAGRLASAVVVWSAETPEARAAALEVHGPALRASDTGRSEAEAEEPALPAGEPITEEASDEAVAVAQAIEAAIQVRGIFSYAPDGRPCLTWYGEQRIAKVIDAALNPPAGQGGYRAMSTQPKIVPTMSCSFCSKTQHEVRTLIAGRQVFICGECVELCQDIVVGEEAERRVREAMKKHGEIIVSAADAQRIAWMKTGEFAPSPTPQGQGERKSDG